MGGLRLRKTIRGNYEASMLSGALSSSIVNNNKSHTHVLISDWDNSTGWQSKDEFRGRVTNFLLSCREFRISPHVIVLSVPNFVSVGINFDHEASPDYSRILLAFFKQRCAFGPITALDTGSASRDVSSIFICKFIFGCSQTPAFVENQFGIAFTKPRELVDTSWVISESFFPNKVVVFIIFMKSTYGLSLAIGKLSAASVTCDENVSFFIDFEITSLHITKLAWSFNDLTTTTVDLNNLSLLSGISVDNIVDDSHSFDTSRVDRVLLNMNPLKSRRSCGSSSILSADFS